MMTPERLKIFEQARCTLFFNGFLSEAENQKVKKRIKKDCDRSGLKVSLKSLFEEETPNDD